MFCLSYKKWENIVMLTIIFSHTAYTVWYTWSYLLHSRSPKHVQKLNKSAWNVNSVSSSMLLESVHSQIMVWICNLMLIRYVVCIKLWGFSPYYHLLLKNLVILMFNVSDIQLNLLSSTSLTFWVNWRFNMVVELVGSGYFVFEPLQHCFLPNLYGWIFTYWVFFIFQAHKWRGVLVIYDKFVFTH